MANPLTSSLLPKVFLFLNGAAGNTGMFIVTALSEDGFVAGSVVVGNENQIEDCVRRAPKIITKLQTKYRFGVNFEVVPWNYTMQHAQLQEAIRKQRAIMATQVQ